MSLSRTALLAACLVCLTSAAEPNTLAPAAHLSYPSNIHAKDGCDFAARSCAPLSDVYGYEKDMNGADIDKKYALVGVVNGLSVVEVDETNTNEPERLKEIKWFRGCPTEWRDIKVWKNYAYVVTDSTSLCKCKQQPCEQTCSVVAGDQFGFPDNLTAVSEGTFSKPLRELGDVPGQIAYDESIAGWDPYACEEFPPAAAAVIKDKIVLIKRGHSCTFSTKVMHAQKAGAKAAIIANNRVDLVPPSMTGTYYTDIPSVMITKSAGDLIIARVQSGDDVHVVLTNSTYRDNDLYQPPNGLWAVDMQNPAQPQLKLNTTQWFDFAHNIYIEEDRPLLYACGMHCVDPSTCSPGAGAGGVMVFNISNPEQPVLLSTWADVYIHDIVVHKRVEKATNSSRYVLFASAIYDARHYFIDVTNPSRLAQNSKLYFPSPAMAHNSFPTADEKYLYLTHEDFDMPVTVWDIEDLWNVKMVGNFSFHVENHTIPHNVFRRDTVLWASYYSEGVLVYNSTSDLGIPEVLGHYDTSPYYTGFHGVWGVYPWMNNRYAFASDMEMGLFLLKYTGVIPVRPSAPSGPPGTPPPADDTPSTSNKAVTFLIIMVCVVIGAGIYTYTRRRRSPGDVAGGNMPPSEDINDRRLEMFGRGGDRTERVPLAVGDSEVDNDV